jgi:AcrR family transcriptional regulator
VNPPVRPRSQAPYPPRPKLAGVSIQKPSPGDAAPRRRKQVERTAESRERLVYAAIDLLGEKGYTRTTLAEIGQRAGVSRGLVTHHFGSKEQCMLAVVEAIRTEVQSILAESGRGIRALDALDLFIDQYLLGEHPKASQAVRAMYVIIIESVTSSPGLLAAVTENNAAVRQMIAGWIAEAQEDGEIEAGANVLDLAIVVEGLLRGVVLQWLAEPAAVDLRRVADLAKSMVRTHLRSSAVS